MKQLMKFHEEVMLKFYLHHSGQLLRVIDSPIYKSKVGDLDQLKKRDNHLIFNIFQVIILRRRADSNIPCNNTLHDDDLQFRIEVSRRIGCIPIYWRNIMRNKIHLDYCNTSERMKYVHSLIKDLKETQSNYRAPCNEMKLAFTFESQEVFGFGGDTSSTDLITTFNYIDKNYQEIINERDFGFESFWSAVGGFIGIFVGASLSQVPTLITNGWIFLKKLRKM